MATVKAGALPFRFGSSYTLDGYTFSGYSQVQEVVSETAGKLVLDGKLVYKSNDPDDAAAGGYKIRATLTISGPNKAGEFTVNYQIVDRETNQSILQFSNVKLNVNQADALLRAQTDDQLYDIFLHQNDTILGSALDDRVNVNRGVDLVEGRGGDDYLSGGGANTLDDGDGDDRITVYSGAGGAAIGGKGNDRIYSAGGADVDGGAGKDVIQQANRVKNSLAEVDGGGGDDTILIGRTELDQTDAVGDTIVSGGAGVDEFTIVASEDNTGDVVLKDFSPTSEKVYVEYEGPARTTEIWRDGAADLDENASTTALVEGLKLAARDLPLDIMQASRAALAEKTGIDYDPETRAEQADAKMAELNLRGYGVSGKVDAFLKLKIMTEALQKLRTSIEAEGFDSDNPVLHALFSGETGLVETSRGDVSLSIVHSPYYARDLLEVIQFEFEDGAQFVLGEYVSGAFDREHTRDWVLPNKDGYEEFILQSSDDYELTFEKFGSDVIASIEGQEFARFEDTKLSMLKAGKNVIAESPDDYIFPWETKLFSKTNYPVRYEEPIPIGDAHWTLRLDGSVETAPGEGLDRGVDIAQEMFDFEYAKNNALRADLGASNIPSDAGWYAFGSNRADDVVWSAPWKGTDGIAFFASGGDDEVSITPDNNRPVIFIDGGSGDDTIYGAGTIFGGRGHDHISFRVHQNQTNSGKQSLIAYGDEGNDVIGGSEVDDLIHGGDGDDEIFSDAAVKGDRVWGDDGDDEITAGDGNDTLRGGDGNDVISAGDGDDRAKGEAGDDLLMGGDGDDKLIGGDGMDELRGGAGRDLLWGGEDGDLYIIEDLLDVIKESNAYSGVDVALVRVDGHKVSRKVERTEVDLDTGVTVLGSAAKDEIHGGAGDDLIKGGGNSDAIFGGDGDDELRGQTGYDVLNGEAGDDVLVGGEGRDHYTGGEGADRFVLGEGSDLDRVWDFTSGEDVLDLRGFHLEDFAAFQALARVNNDGDTVVDFGDGDMLKIYGVDIAGIAEADVLL